MNWYGLLQVTVRITLAAIIGVLFGYRSYKKGKPAGLKTHMLVSTASALIMMLGAYYSEKYNSDAMRLSAQVISGIGFIGAGAIIKDGLSPIGITTAASIWACACLGLACGAGFYIPTLICVAVMFSILSIATLVEARIDRKKISTESEKEEKEKED